MKISLLNYPKKGFNNHSGCSVVEERRIKYTNRLQSLDKNSVQPMLKIRICLATKPKANDVKLRRMLKKANSTEVKESDWFAILYNPEWHIGKIKKH